jgi:hypothetical protein
MIKKSQCEQREEEGVESEVIIILFFLSFTFKLEEMKKRNYLAVKIVFAVKMLLLLVIFINNS